MDTKTPKPPKQTGSESKSEELAKFAQRVREAKKDRMDGYREQSLRIHPWVCARCGRQFTNKNLHLLTVHHKDHNHDNNPKDGSNWENLCVYCHDNEHGRYAEDAPDDNASLMDEPTSSMTHSPFASLGDILKKKKR